MLNKMVYVDVTKQEIEYLKEEIEQLKRQLEYLNTKQASLFESSQKYIRILLCLWLVVFILNIAALLVNIFK